MVYGGVWEVFAEFLTTELDKVASCSTTRQLATMCGIINWKMRALEKRNKWKMANGKLPLAVNGDGDGDGDGDTAAAAEWVKCEARQP